MFKYATPEECGVSSESVKKYLSLLEKYGLSTHDVILSRGDKIFFEKYYPPFTAEMPHRMYSVTKSFVSIAIGFLIQDGKLSLDDRVVDFFKDDVPEDIAPHVKEQTVRDMLMMSTGFPNSRGNWFSARCDDRVRYYFKSASGELNPKRDLCKIPGTLFEYDSNGSFILGALVERISGKSLDAFLRERLFDKIGVSDSLHMLKCPGGHSWGDSALICTPLDLLKTARFTLNLGEWEGEQILSRRYLEEATSRLIDTSGSGLVSLDAFGYGYQIWRTWEDSFFFNGMGCQFAVCVPHKDMILIYNGDNQGNPIAKSVIIDRFFEEIVDNAKDEPLPKDKDAENALNDYCKDLKLFVARGGAHSDTEDKINGKTFYLGENPMNISKVRFTFKNGEGVLEYTRGGSDKVLPFGLGKNAFAEFPESVSDTVGSVTADGHFYRCAVSAAWTEPTKLGIAVQAIDEYFGRLYFLFSFKKEGAVALSCTKTAEDFFNGYGGYADGQLRL